MNMEEISEGLEIGEDRLKNKKDDNIQEESVMPTDWLSSVSFRQRVMDFWQLFLEWEHELRYRIVKGEEDSILSMERLLQNVFTKPVFQLQQKEERFELIVSPDGSGSRLYQLAYWRTQAPEEIWLYWDILIGIQRVEHPELVAMDVAGHSLSAVNIQVWPILLSNGRMGLEVYSDELQELGEDNSYIPFYALLEQCIGELSLMSNIEYVNILEQPAMEPSISLAVLDRYIMNLQIAGQLPPQDDPLELFTSYTMEPPHEIVYLRDDIYFGNTSAAALPLLNAYYLGEKELFVDAAQEGVLWGFLFYVTSGIDEGQRVDVRSAIEQELNQQLSERGLGECVGSASGYQYAYLDCICYDWEAFVEIVQKVMEPYMELYQIPMNGFAELQKNGNQYILQIYEENIENDK